MHRKTKVIMTQSDINQIKQDTAPPVDIDTLDDFENMDITDNIILLMDDVTTTGNSLYACKEILMEKGAKQVEMFALGKAI